MFTIEFLRKQKFEAMKTKNKAISNVVSSIIGDFQTQATTNEGIGFVKKVAGEKDPVFSPVTEEEYIGHLLSKMIKNLTESIGIYEKRGDTERKEQAQAEVDYIQSVFFPPLSVEFLKEKADEFKAAGKKKGDFMNFLKENYLGRYNGGEANKLF